MIYIVIGGLSLILIFIFLGLAFLFPELVGIAGKKAKEIEGAHTCDTTKTIEKS